MNPTFFAALEVERLSWWLWIATADSLIAYGPSDRIAIYRLKALWEKSFQ
jgi:hypothetical protein